MTRAYFRNRVIAIVGVVTILLLAVGLIIYLFILGRLLTALITTLLMKMLAVWLSHAAARWEQEFRQFRLERNHEL